MQVRLQLLWSPPGACVAVGCHAHLAYAAVSLPTPSGNGHSTAAGNLHTKTPLLFQCIMRLQVSVINVDSVLPRTTM